MSSEILRHTPELAQLTYTLGLLTIAAFSARQRTAIRKRDKNKCNFPADHNCKGRLEVHHILPQRYCETVGIEDPDFPENGITICENSHRGEVAPGEFGIHPDMAYAKKAYRKNPKSFEEAFGKRNEKLESKQIYWNNKWDRQLSATAVKNTQNALKDGWKFPSVRKKK